VNPPRERGGGPGYHPEAPTTTVIGTATKQPDQAHRSTQGGQAEVVARGFYAPPAGRRTIDATIVPSCPKCLFLHPHRENHGGNGRWSS